MSKVLTIVIPSYNVEMFLDNTLKSFVCEKNVMDKFEVIVVDDGSKDKTSEIGNAYAEKYPNTFKIIWSIIF